MSPSSSSSSTTLTGCSPVHTPGLTEWPGVWYESGYRDDVSPHVDIHEIPSWIDMGDIIPGHSHITSGKRVWSAGMSIPAHTVQTHNPLALVMPGGSPS